MFVYNKIMENTTSLINSPPRRDNDFEEWLSTNGYFYMRTKDKYKRPCFKSKLTRNLYTEFKKETARPKTSKRQYRIKNFK